MVALILPLAAVIYMLVRLGRQVSTATWRATAEKPLKRAVAVVTGLALVVALAWVWWPRTGTFRPILPDEGGTITDLLRPLSAGTVPGTVPGVATAGSSRAAPAWQAGDRGAVQTVWDSREPLPTQAEPQLAVVMQPQQTDASTGDSAQPEAWIFPFDQPLAPDPGDNQALAVVTEDDSVVYDVALALVWVEDGDAALNTNEAYAFASCNSCAAVAVAFQVVLVVGDNDVAAPQNLAGAVNYNCVNCLTYAVAQQLFVTLDGPLSEDAMTRLNEIWAAIAAFGEQIATMPLDQIDDQLDAFEAAILEVIEADQPGTVTLPSMSPSEGTSEDPSESPTQSPSGSPSDGTDTSPSGSPGSSPSSSTSPSSPSPSSPTTSSPTSPSAAPTG